MSAAFNSGGRLSGTPLRPLVSALSTYSCQPMIEVGKRDVNLAVNVVGLKESEWAAASKKLAPTCVKYILP
jgi:hypothetical protein